MAVERHLRPSTAVLTSIGRPAFQHLGPPHPQMADRPFPDFVQPIYAAEAQNFDAGLLLPDEHPSEFVGAEWALAVIHPAQRPLLEAALKASQVTQGNESVPSGLP